MFSWKVCGNWRFLFVFFTITDYSGDVKRENRFVRAPPRLSSQPIRRPGDRPQRPAIINPEDLKDLDELDNDCEDGWAGQYFLELFNCLRSFLYWGQIRDFSQLCDTYFWIFTGHSLRVRYCWITHHMPALITIHCSDSTSKTSAVSP